jgi:predicted HAD superfamily Cof-like phosphohydrolase
MYEYYDAMTYHPMTPMEMVQEFAAVTEQEPNAPLYEKLILEEFEEWRNETTDKAAELKELADLVYVIYGYANAKGYDLEEAVQRVHDNNLGRCVQEDGTVKRREDGKIIKNPDYPKPVMEDLV